MEQCSSQNCVLPSSEYELWSRYSRYIYKLCLQKCGNFEAAKEFYQEIYIKYHLHATNVAKHTRPDLWFKRVIDNAWYSELRKRMRKAPMSPLGCHEESIIYEFNDENPETLLRHIEECSILNAMEKMLIQYIFIGFSYSELSEIIGLTERTLRRKVHKALLRLEK